MDKTKAGNPNTTGSNSCLGCPNQIISRWIYNSEAIELDEEMSEARPVHPGRLVEPVVFEPKLKIRLSRSTYKVNSYIDFGPYKESFKKFDAYLGRFHRDLHSRDYVGALADLDKGRPKDQMYMKGKKIYFSPGTCKWGSCNCRVQKQYIPLFNGVYSKFLQAIDHMEYHPTLGKEKKGSSVRLWKRSPESIKASLARQLKYLTRDDIEMLQQGNEILQKQLLKNNYVQHGQKCFGLVSWILGWGVYSNAHNIMSIKCNIQALYI